MEYSVKQINENCWRIASPLGVFMDLIIGSERALLWDTGYGMGDLKKMVREITDLPLYIVNSHGHVDHACGNYQFEEPIYIHPEDMELCRRHNDRLQRMLAVEMARTMLPEFNSKVLGGEIDTERYCGYSCGNLLPVTEGHVFDLGGVHLKVIELSGHTKGSIGLLYEERNMLYVGDALNDSLWLFLPEAADLSIYTATIRKAIDLKPDCMVLSHREIPADTSELKYYLELACNIDYENGIPFSAPLVPGATAMLCCRRGFSPDDAGKEGFASIVINRDHM